MSEEIAYGGLAVIEGVMIRSPRYWALACRLSSGDIDVHTEPVRGPLQRHPWVKKIPLVRGLCGLWELLITAWKALERSGNLALEETGQQLGSGLMALNIVLALAIGLGLFIVAPNLLADFLKRWLGDHPLLLNLVEGLVRFALFLGYLWGVAQLPDIRRVFAYHGAEHKVVNAFEQGEALTRENVRWHRTLHQRCGTTFVFLVLTLKIFAFALLPWTSEWYWRVLMRVALVPLVVGVAFELIYLTNKHRQTRWAQVLVAPGLWMQRLTAQEPTDDMLEVALVAFHAARRAEETGELTCEVLPGQTAG
ncbi:MAG TPA: DUF1385 domain-containing protein [Armatimonadetes bacterium]|nr:DUF1385 domain-containing protein [Armatimonadota bacterium]